MKVGKYGMKGKVGLTSNIGGIKSLLNPARLKLGPFKLMNC